MSQPAQDAIVIEGRKIRIDSARPECSSLADGRWYITTGRKPSDEYLRKDGKWGIGTGGNAFWPTREAAEAFARQVAARSVAGEGIGPQRGPAGVRQIEAQAKQAARELAATSPQPEPRAATDAAGEQVIPTLNERLTEAELSNVVFLLGRICGTYPQRRQMLPHVREARTVIAQIADRLYETQVATSTPPATSETAQPAAEIRPTQRPDSAEVASAGADPVASSRAAGFSDSPAPVAAGEGSELQHGMNCGHYDGEIGCTCCLLERQRIAELEGQVQKLLGEMSRLPAATELATLRDNHDRMSDCLDKIRRVLESRDYASRMNQLDAIRDLICFPLPATKPEEVFDEIVAELQEQLATLKQRCEAAERERGEAQSKLRRVGACEACWSNSWVPVPADDPDAVKLSDGSFARCDKCWLKKQNDELRLMCKALDEAAKANLYGFEVSQSQLTQQARDWAEFDDLLDSVPGMPKSADDYRVPTFDKLRWLVERVAQSEAERDAAVKRAEWYRKLAIAFGAQDIGMNPSGLYIGGGHISKDRIIPCERDADGLPVETKEIREAIE